MGKESLRSIPNKGLSVQRAYSKNSKISEHINEIMEKKDNHRSIRYEKENRKGVKKS